MKLIRYLFPSSIIFLTLSLIGCSPNLPVYKAPQLPTQKIVVGILPFTDSASTYSNSYVIKDFQNLFATMAYNTSAFDDVKTFDNKSDAKDVDYLIQGQITNMKYDRGATIGTFGLSILTALGGLILISNPDTEVWGLCAEAGALGFALEGLIDKHFYYHDYDLTVSFQLLEAQTGNIVYSDKFSHSLSLTFDEARTYSYGGTITPSGFMDGVQTETVKEDMNSINDYCFYYCFVNGSEKFVRKISELNIPQGGNKKEIVVEKSVPMTDDDTNEIKKGVVVEKSFPETKEFPDENNSNESAPITKKFLESQFYISSFNKKMDIGKNWGNIKNDFAIRFTNKRLIDSFNKYQELFITKDSSLIEYVEDQLNKNGVYKVDLNYDFYYYTLLARITLFEDYFQKSSDAAIDLLTKLSNNSEIKNYKEMDNYSLEVISSSFEARKKYAELIDAKLLFDAAEDEMLHPTVKIFSSPVRENEQLECHKLQTLLTKKEFPTLNFNERNYSNTFTNIFTAKYFASARDKNQTFIESQVGDGAGDIFGISLISNAVRYRYFPNSKENSYFSLYSFGLGIVLPLTDIFEEEKLGIYPDNSTIYLKGKDYSNANFRIYAGNIEILNKYQNVNKIKWFNTNIEAGADINYKLSIFNFQAGLKYVYNSFYYYGGIGFNVGMPYREGEALLKFDMPDGISKESSVPDNSGKGEYVDNHQTIVPSPSISKGDNVINNGMALENLPSDIKKEIAAEKPAPVVQPPITKWEITGINFGLNNTKFSPESYPILFSIADSLMNNPGLSVEIRAYTDNVGAETYNLSLSQKRADAVYNYLVSKGIQADRLTSIGYGESNPIGDNTTSEGRAMNNRIEFRVISE